MNTDIEYINEEKKLLPCPFCGGEADIKQNCRNGYYLKCAKCLIGIRQKVFHKSMEWLRSKMIENWNTRKGKIILIEKIAEQEIEIASLKNKVKELQSDYMAVQTENQSNENHES